MTSSSSGPHDHHASPVHDDDAVHAHDDHAHDDHTHDDHGHEDHGHDDHGHEHHGHDDHAPDEPQRRGVVRRRLDHGGHGHTHGQLNASDPAALRVVILSSLVLGVVAAAEIVGSVVSNSAGILADALHNLGDVSTTVALAGAFLLSRRAPSQRFPYGYHRGEDLAGLVVLLLMVASAVASGVTSVEHLVHPPRLHSLGLALALAVIGVVGNEIVGVYKTAAGRRLGSMALVADGRHSRIDGLASLGAAVGIGGAWAGFPLLDPLAGLLITAIIAAVSWDTARNVSGRLLDEADASLVETVRDVALATPGVLGITDVRMRWTGRRVRAEISVEVDGSTPVSAAHAIGESLRHELHHHVESLADVLVHLDPADDEAAHRDVQHHH